MCVLLRDRLWSGKDKWLFLKAASLTLLWLRPTSARVQWQSKILLFWLQVNGGKIIFDAGSPDMWTSLCTRKGQLLELVKLGCKARG